MLDNLGTILERLGTHSVFLSAILTSCLQLGDVNPSKDFHCLQVPVFI